MKQASGERTFFGDGEAAEQAKPLRSTGELNSAPLTFERILLAIDAVLQFKHLGLLQAEPQAKEPSRRGLYRPRTKVMRSKG